MKKDCIYSAVVHLPVIAKDEVLKQSQNRTQSRFGNFKKRLLRFARNEKIEVFQSSLMTHFDRYRTNGFAFLNAIRKRAGFTLIELIIATSILSIIALLIYPAYRASSRSYQLSVVQSNLQQNARIGMKKMVKELEAGMVVMPNAKGEGTINYGYDKEEPYKMALYTWSMPGSSDNDMIALYAALSTANTEPMDPALSLEGQEPLLYMRKYDSSLSNPEWSDPEPFTLSDVKVTQLNFIIGGDNQDQILITLELAQQGPLKEWRTYRIASAARLGAR